MSTPWMTPAELMHRGLEVLSKELGTADAIRFVNLYSKGHGDYTEERRQMFAGVTIEQLVADIQAGRANTPPPGAEVVGQPPA